MESCGKTTIYYYMILITVSAANCSVPDSRSQSIPFNGDTGLASSGANVTCPNDTVIVVTSIKYLYGNNQLCGMLSCPLYSSSLVVRTICDLLSCPETPTRQLIFGINDVCQNENKIRAGCYARNSCSFAAINVTRPADNCDRIGSKADGIYLSYSCLKSASTVTTKASTDTTRASTATTRFSPATTRFPPATIKASTATTKASTATTRASTVTTSTSTAATTTVRSNFWLTKTGLIAGSVTIAVVLILVVISTWIYCRRRNLQAMNQSTEEQTHASRSSKGLHPAATSDSNVLSRNEVGQPLLQKDAHVDDGSIAEGQRSHGQRSHGQKSHGQSSQGQRSKGHTDSTTIYVNVPPQ